MFQKKRIAILGLMLESNSFAPVTDKDDFLSRLYLAGIEFAEELRKDESKLPTEMRSFCTTMDVSIEWEPVPILIGLVEAGGPIDSEFFLHTLADMKGRLEAAMPLDAVYICNHGAMITTENRDPDAEIFAMTRAVVGADTPIVATLDLHGNVSDRMVEAVDLIIAYQTNPHVDMVARGKEAALAMVEILNGLRPVASIIRLPVTPPTVTLLTEKGPYADLMNYSQSKKDAEIMNISVLGGFAYADTPKNGLAIIVTARSDKALADATVRDIADFA
ncbi:MAG: Microcystinase [Rhizobium sp.]|nr:Microcystinase [Rhizobium sp.]